MTLRKLMRNKGLTAALLAGFILASAMAAVTPLYAKSSLQRTFLKELQAYQEDTGVYPGTVLTSVSYNENSLLEHLKDLKADGTPAFSSDKVNALLSERRSGIHSLTAWAEALPGRFNVDTVASVSHYATMIMQMEVADSLNNTRRNGRLHSLTGLETSAVILDGRFPEARDDGVLEVMLSRAAAANLDLSLGQTLSLRARLDTSMKPIVVLIVGVFGVDPNASYAWGVFSPDKLSDGLVIRWEDMLTLLGGDPMLVNTARFYAALNYNQMNVEDIAAYSALISALSDELEVYSATIDMPVIKRVSGFQARERSLRATLWMLNIPVITLLLLYMVMVARMIIANDEGEIALLASRGAGRCFISGVYALFGSVPACFALAAGPPFAWLMCRVLGASNGFLSFVNRASLPVQLNGAAWLYCLVALTPAVLLMSLAASRRATHTVVSHRQQAAKGERKPVWMRYGLDMILLFATAAIWIGMTYRPELLPDWIIYGLMPLFSIAASLFFLRLYPFALRFVYWIGRRFWRPPAYIAFLRVSRHTGAYRFIMLFLILTVSVGLFSASAARTLGENANDQIDYRVGADMVLTPNWPRVSTNTGIRAQEPSFLPYGELPGVANAAKVLRRSGMKAQADRASAQGVEAVGIEPAAFGRVAWTRNDLLAVHINEYLNALTLHKNGCILSKSLALTLHVSRGDWIKLAGDGSGEFGVLAIAEYWPGQDSGAHWVVADLGYMQDTLGAEPYEIWLRMEQNAPSADVYSAILQQKLPIIGIEDARQMKLEQVLSADRLAVNGAMTLGFIVSCTVCMLGFLLYWLFSMRSRRVELGLQRGLGLTRGELIRMILWEQALTAIVSLMMGIIVGALGSRLFVPLFLTASKQAQYIPLRWLSERSDRLKLYGILSAMLLICWSLLAAKLVHMRAAQAIKMGEDEA